MPLPQPLRLTLIFLLAAVSLQAAYDFGPWATGTSPREIGRRVSANFVPRPHMLLGQYPVIHYAEACTWYGALTFAQLTQDAVLQTQLVQRFEPFFREEKNLIPTPQHVDWTVFGSVPLEIFIQTKDLRCLALGEWMAQRQWGDPYGEHIEPRAREHQANGLSWQTRLWIDDMFMITMVQTQAYRATGNRLYLDRTAKEMVYYLDQLQQPGGLFYHKPGVPYYWGRGNGWMAAGMAELLRSLPIDNSDRPRILAGYQLMMAALLKHQGNDGMWHQLIDGPDSWPESSGTGMFTFAFIAGVKEGWLDEKTYGPAARKGWLALIGYLDANASLREVCAGTGAKNDRQHYLDRPRITGDFHGQAPVLWCANALLRESPPPPAPAATAGLATSSATLRSELEAMMETDQSQRLAMMKAERDEGRDSAAMTALWKKQNEIDARNLARLEAIIAEHGWPKRSAVGDKAALAAFLILQHADLAHQKKYLDLTRAAVATKEMEGSYLALLEDRVQMREGKGQIYGSQLQKMENGEYAPTPIENEAQVDQRRAAVGLQPLAEYVKSYNDQFKKAAPDR